MTYHRHLDEQEANSSDYCKKHDVEFFDFCEQCFDARLRANTNKALETLGMRITDKIWDEAKEETKC